MDADSNSPPDDLIALVRAAQDGDEAALGHVVERTAPELRAYIRLNTGDELRRIESCSDIVQSVCREVVRDIAQFRGEAEAQFRHWLFTLALHKIQSRARFHRAERRDARRNVGDLRSSTDRDSRTASLSDAYRTFSTPSYALSSQEELARIESAFERLAPDYQQIINLCCVVGMSHREAAAEMGRAETAVRKLLSRARAQLALLIAKDG